jgi:uncharacterized YceG family protein
VGLPATINVTIPEGTPRTAIAQIAADAHLKGSYMQASAIAKAGFSPRAYGAPASTRSLEGFLFPATYQLLPGAPAADLVAEQLAAFKQNFAKVNLGYARRKNLTPYDVLTIASMVEREASAPSERPLIAAVIYNRLAQGMTLGIDATLRYALNDFSQPLTESQLSLDTPYNTRLHHGLPPTPIGNPGMAAIQAAAHPANVPYLYYVVKPGTCGQDAFSTSYSQFLANVAAYDNARAAAGDRSPTSCPG